MGTLMIGNWREEQRHPAVLAYLEAMAPSESEYPMPEEDMLETIKSLKGLPGYGKFICVYEDQEDEEQLESVQEELGGLTHMDLGNVGGFDVYLYYRDDNKVVYWESQDTVHGGAGVIVRGELG